MLTQAMDRITRWVGHPAMIPGGLAVVGTLYAVAGVDVANITISIVTFLLLPVLQHSQNRDGAAIQAKLDELIRSSAARDEFLGIDRKSENEIEQIRHQDEGGV